MSEKINELPEALRVDAESTDSVHVARLEAERDNALSRIRELESQLEHVRKDSLQSANSVSEKSLKLRIDACEFVGSEVAADCTRSDASILAAAVLKLDPSCKIEGKSEAYLEARLDLAREQIAARNDAKLAAVVSQSETVEESAVDKARRSHHEYLQNAWKKEGNK